MSQQQEGLHAERITEQLTQAYQRVIGGEFN